MIETRAVVGTPHASRYLQQLAKHWAHKFETTFDPHSARIALPFGEARLSATDAALTIDLSTDDAGKLPDFRAVLVRHIERFAFRETLHFDWT
ncbi:DUF2218 domain-containing protein [Methylobacterium sp. Gmos1]